MEKFQIVGGERLFGSVKIPSSKNAYLPILASTILCQGKVVLHKNPRFVDIYNMCAILEDLGSIISFDGDDIVIDNSCLNKYTISVEKASTVRSSIFSLGAILARFGKAQVAMPGGCEIGARPIDIHIKGLESLGVKIEYNHGFLHCNVDKLVGTEINLDFPSVGATENIMLASIFANGETKIYNPAKEPEIVDLQNFLICLGANVKGAGTNCITIIGVKKLKDYVEYTPISDRIIAGTYALAVASCGGEVEIQNVNREHIMSVMSKIQNNNCKIQYNDDKIYITSNGNMSAVNKIETSVYPGFPTDMQAQMMATLTTAKGTSIIIENLFENRFKHIPELIKMGAKITQIDNLAVVEGVENLFGADVCVCDLRGGAALVLAGLKAKGYSTLNNVGLIDRGYYKIEQDLQSLGAKIKRIKVD